MTPNAAPLANRFEGRLFAEDGHLYFVVEVNAESGVARVSCRIDGERKIVEMPISEIGARLSSGADLQLDGVHASDNSGRITEKDDGYYFATRDGLEGPFLTEDAASRALDEFIRSVKKKD